MNRKQRRAAKLSGCSGGPSPPSLDEGLRRHQAGETEAARRIYLAILAREPDNADALHLLGVLDLRAGDLARAIERISRSTALRPAHAEAHNNLGVALSSAGQVEQAAAAYRRAIEIEPNAAEQRANLGNALTALGDIEAAITAYKAALTLRPDHAKAHTGLANALWRAGRTGEAEQALRMAIDNSPAVAEWRSNLGVILNGSGRHEEAAAALRQAIGIKPDHAEAWAELATACKELGHMDEAAEALERAVALKPDVAGWRRNLGLAYSRLGRFEEAAAAYARAVELQPDEAEAHFELALAVEASGRPEAATSSFHRAIDLRPDWADAYGALSLNLLKLGALREGFELYRWRWRVSNLPEAMPAVSCPLWEGEDLTSKAILVHCEQGFGDSLQFIRYARPLTQMARRVRVLASPVLFDLFRSVPGLEVGDTYAEEDYDFHVPLMCLPRLFGTTLETIPNSVPYLSPAPAEVRLWAQRLADFATGLKIGLVWSGDPRPHDPVANALDRRRSLHLHEFVPLLGLAGTSFLSLQKGEAAAQIGELPNGLQIIDFTDELQTFADTAALVANLDLVITVDTAVAHLAGALGKPVWILSRFDGCWRWLNHREDSPWYPTARLFHQRASGDWAEVVARVAAELRQLTQSRQGAPAAAAS